MEPHLLRTFVAVARCRSFSMAARELRYTHGRVGAASAAARWLAAVLAGADPGILGTDPGRERV